MVLRTHSGELPGDCELGGLTLALSLSAEGGISLKEILSQGTKASSR